MLSTADYGMVGQLTIFSLIASTIQESGFTAALVNRPTIEHRDYNAVFWFSLPASLFLYTLLFFAAPFIADYYRDARLIPLSRYLFLSFIISSMSIAPLCPALEADESARKDPLQPCCHDSFWGSRYHTCLSPL